MMTKSVVYPGTFDPITLGHVDILKRASLLFDEVIVAVATSAGKSPFFSLDERVRLVEESVSSFSRVRVFSFSGLLVDWMKSMHVNVILRGVRTEADMGYEFQLAETHKALHPHIEVVFLKGGACYAHISSTWVREIGAMGGDLSSFVSPAVIQAFYLKRGFPHGA